MKDDRLPFFSHLKELRDRILVCVISLGLAFIVTYTVKEIIFDYLMRPFITVMPEKSTFIFTGVTEAFITYFKISIVSALFLVSPVILYEVWKFVAPGLYAKEKKYLIPFILFGSLFFIGGACFCYYIFMPFIYGFFVGFASDFVIPMPDIKSYMGLTLKLLVFFGLFFQFPLLTFLLARAGIINAKTLTSKRRYAVLGMFIASALFTPPDIVSQFMVALPLWGMYELSILIIRFSGKKEPVHEES